MTAGLTNGCTRKVRHAAALAVAAIAALLAPAAPASAATRYAAPASTDTSGACTAIAPCRLDHAVNNAASGDEVIVQPGDYAVTWALAPAVPVHVHGAVGQPRPRLIGAVSLTGPTVYLGGGGSLRHLYVESNASLLYAVELVGGVGSDLELYSPAGGGAELNGVTGGTILRDSVARSGGTSPVQTKDGAGNGPVKVINVTAIGTNSASTGLKGKQSSGTTTVRNVIARGTIKDLEVLSGSNLTIGHSNFRAATSTGPYTNAGSNQSAAPAFADLAGGDLRPVAGSVTVDAGAIDTDLGSFDPDGRLRVLGTAPDIGAYELDPTAGGAGTGDAGGSGGTGGTDGGTTAVLPPPAPPVIGSTVGLGPSSGVIRVRPPGSSDFVELEAGASVPVGSVIDATTGVVELTSAKDDQGATQTGSFWGGMFRVEQSAAGGGYTDLVLAGGDFSRCPRASASRSGLAHTSARRSRRVRHLWGRDKRGRFRSRGRRGHAVVRGTTWLTEDRCNGTYFKVTEGAIDVKRNGAKKAKRLRAGQGHLIRR